MYKRQVLDQFAKSRTNVIFVIPPVNAKWMKYTGLSQEKYEQAVQKIRYQLESQGSVSYTHLPAFEMVTVDPDTATPSPDTLAEDPDSFTVEALLSS